MANPTQVSLIGVVSILVFVAAVALPCGPARGEDFRVENKVFMGNDSEAKILSSTIFYGGVVYDFLRSLARSRFSTRPASGLSCSTRRGGCGRRYRPTRWRP